MSSRIKLIEERREALRFHRKRTNVTATELLQRFPAKTKGLSSNVLYGWLSGSVKTADASLYMAVLNIWKRLPDQESYMDITSEILSSLRAHSERTGVGAIKLCAHAEGMPDGLNCQKISNWLLGQNKRVRQDHLEYVMRKWQALPDKIERVEITPEILATLHGHKDRTGISSMALLRNTNKERPPGLTSTLINSWMEGRTKSAQKDHLEYVLKKWREFSGPSNRVELTPEILSELRQQQTRTGIGPVALLRDTRRERPAGLTSTVIRHWMEGGAKSASKDHLNYVLQKWRHLPDA